MVIVKIHPLLMAAIMILSMGETSALIPRSNLQFLKKDPIRIGHFDANTPILIQQGMVARTPDSSTYLMMSKKTSENVDDAGNAKKSFDGIMFPPGLIFVAAVVWPLSQDPLVLAAVVIAIVALYNLFLLSRED